MSGGEQQMLAIGRCLMGAPELIMFDEPSLGLAPLVVQEVLHTIRLLNQRGLTILLVEQNVAVSLRISNRAYVLENGRIVMSGAGELLHDEPRAAGLSRPLNRSSAMRTVIIIAIGFVALAVCIFGPRLLGGPQWSATGAKLFIALARRRARQHVDRGE